MSTSYSVDVNGGYCGYRDAKYTAGQELEEGFLRNPSSLGELMVGRYDFL